MSTPPSYDEFESLSWLPPFVRDLDSKLLDIAQGKSSLADSIAVLTCASEFEKRVRDAFVEDQRFLDQFSDPRDFNSNPKLASMVLDTLNKHFSSCFNSISISVSPVSASSAPDRLSILKTAHVYLKAIASLVRVLRNLATQATIRAAKLDFLPSLFQAPLDVVTAATAISSSLDATTMEIVGGLARSVVQFASNLVSNSTQNCVDAVWPLVFPSWVRALELNASDHRLITFFLALVHNASTSSPALIVSVARDQVALKSIVTAYMALHVANDGHIDPDTVHWMHVLCKKLWIHFEAVIASLAEQEGEEMRVTKEQVFMLHMLDSFVENWVKDNPNHPVRELFGEVTLSLVHYLVDNAFKVNLVSRVCSALKPDVAAASDDLDKLSVEFGWVSLQIVANMTPALDLKEKSTELGLRIVRSVALLLGQIQALVAAEGLVPRPDAAAAPSRPPIDEQNEFVGFKTILIRILANMVYHCKAVQDELRDANAIPLLLAGCKDDLFNPVVREWALFACRNLCEFNEENQQLIASMKMTGVLPSVELEDMGFKAVLEETGKIRLEKVDMTEEPPK